MFTRLDKSWKLNVIEPTVDTEETIEDFLDDDRVQFDQFRKGSHDFFLMNGKQIITSIFYLYDVFQSSLLVEEHIKERELGN